MVASMEKMSLNRAGDSLQPSHPLPEGLPRSGLWLAVKKPHGKLGFATVSTLFVLRTNKLRAGVFTSVRVPPLKVSSQRNRKVNHIFKLVLIVTGRLSEQFQDHLFPLSLYYKIFLELDGAREIIFFFCFLCLSLLVLYVKTTLKQTWPCPLCWAACLALWTVTCSSARL